MKRSVVASAVVVILLGLSADGLATGFMILNQNGSGMGNSYAGAGAAAEDASTIFFNPAGLTYLPGRQFVVSGNLVYSSVEFSNTASTPPALPPGSVLGGTGGDAGDLAFLPATYLSWQVNPDTYLGIGVNTPFGLKTEYDAGWMGRFYALKSEAKSVNINPTIAFKVNDTFSVGFGVDYQWFKTELTNSVNYAAAAAGACVPQPACIGPALGAVGAQTEGVASLEGDDWAWGYNLGVMINAGAARIGLTYRSSFTYTLAGNATFSNRPAVLSAQIPDGPIKSSIKLPALVSSSIAYQINPRWQMLADITWTQWSDLKQVDVIRADTGAQLSSLVFNWRDTWRMGLGFNYQMNEAWKLRMGAAYEETPTNDVNRDPRLPDPDRLWLAFGAQYRVGKQGAIDVGYSHSWRTASINQAPPNISANTAAANGQLVGDVQNNVDIIAVQYRYDF